MDPVHFEALRKLGLLKGDEVEPGPNLSPRMSPKARSSWAAPPSPRSPATPHRQHFTPSNTYVHSLPPVSVPVPLLSPAAVPPSVQLPDFLPVPDAFCDSLGPQASDNEPSAAVGVSEADVHAQEKTPPVTPLKLTPPRIVGVKSATLERSGLGLSSSFNIEGSGEDGDLNPRQLRNNRPRPASLGSGKEFSSTQREAVARQEPEYRRSVQAPRRSLPAPTYQHSRDSSKLPRSQGISVLICPRSENEEDRRQALRRLGLLRDWRLVFYSSPCRVSFIHMTKASLTSREAALLHIYAWTLTWILSFTLLTSTCYWYCTLFLFLLRLARTVWILLTLSLCLWCFL